MKPRLFIGDEEVDVSDFQLNHTLEPVRGFKGRGPTYITGLKSTTVEATMAATPEVLGLFEEVPLQRDFSFYLTSTYHWSRWRCWLNAILRIAWWPLGPKPLPKTYPVDIQLPQMKIESAELRGGLITISARQEVQHGD